MSINPAALPRNHPAAAAPKALLQLNASRGKLALELAEPFDVGPLSITHLVSTLDGLRFPVDLSGGVARFRHRRGLLEHLGVEARLASLASFLTPRARHALDSRSLRLALLPREHGLTVGAHDERFAVAFDATFAPDEQYVQFVISNARSIGLEVHSHATALRLARALAGPNAEHDGSRVSMPNALVHLAREVLLDAGARLPSCAGLHLGWRETADGVRVVASSSDCDFDPTINSVRALELTRISGTADEALVHDRLEEVRAAYVAALEAAPRHPELVLRVAELDALAGNSPESALATIIEVMPAVDGGIVASTLLAAVGEWEAASVAARRAAESEPYGPLASRILALSAAHSPDATTELALLDEAVARCPSCVQVRWQRSKRRLAVGRFDDAAADFGQLEAGARGSAARFDVCLESGRRLLDAGQHRDARVFFERALRYAPRSAEASLGLARAFLALGDERRGVALLSRAVTLLENSDARANTIVIELARALAEHTRDLPAAIYHVRSIPFGIEETIAARALEGRWRCELDDIVGASLAFAQAREAAGQLPLDTIARNAAWLTEAARFELDIHRDPLAAKRHAEAALRACPQDREVENLFRRAAVAVSDAERQSRSVSQESIEPSDPRQEPVEPSPPSEPVAVRPTDPPPPAPATTRPPPMPLEVSDSELEDESQIDHLTDRVRANPDDQQAVRTLCSLLERAGRMLDLMALVSARLEETSDPDLRTYLRDVHVRTLSALIEECRANGRTDEAEMYEMVMAGLEQD